MTFQHFEVIIKHFKGGDVCVFEGNEFELNHFPKLDDAVDLFLHLGFVLSYLTDFFDCFFIVEESKIPQKL